MPDHRFSVFDPLEEVEGFNEVGLTEVIVTFALLEEFDEELLEEMFSLES